MTLPDQDGTKKWVGRTVVDRYGAEIGVCAALMADTTTGVPEWIHVERGEVTLIVPLLDAKESGGRIHVTVTRAYADGAPRFGPTSELTRDQEAALYRHYGIGYSAATSESILPADAELTEAPPTDVGPTDAEDTAAAPVAAVRQLVTSGAARRGPGVAAAVAALVALTAAVAAVRLRRGTSRGSSRALRRGAPPPKSATRRVRAIPTATRAGSAQVAATARPVVEASRRLARRGASAGAASLHRAAVDTAQRSRAASTAARACIDVTARLLAPLLTITGLAAWRAVRAGTDSVLRITDAATESVVAAAPRVAAGTARAGWTGLNAVLTVGATAAAVPEVVAETGERLEKRWRRLMSKLSLGLGFGVGFVLGARAGRERYEEIKQAAAGFVERPEVQQVLERARAAAPAPLQGGIDKLSGRASGGAGTGAGTSDGGPLTVDDLDVLVPPPPPVAGTGGSSGTDPLDPPPTSGDDPIARP